MKQICRFMDRPPAVAGGGWKKGRYIVWLNLNAEEIPGGEGQPERFQSVTDRLALSGDSLEAFLAAVDDTHLAIATDDEVSAVLRYFRAESDTESWRAVRRAQIRGHDRSGAVNRFYLGGRPLWLDKATRVGLVNSVSAEKRNGGEVTDLWFGTVRVRLPADDALAMLDKIELYAKSCYNVTARHLAQVEDMDCLESLRQFDIKADYPPCLDLDIDD